MLFCTRDLQNEQLAAAAEASFSPESHSPTLQGPNAKTKTVNKKVAQLGRKKKSTRVALCCSLSVSAPGSNHLGTTADSVMEVLLL